jgi:GntR family transcriptional repressor for pyruvate dehydrogenase complex
MVRKSESPASAAKSATQSVFQALFKNVSSGHWPIGSAIPSERTLMQEYGVSRIALREALSMLRGMGVLDVGHGRRTVVRKVDTETFGQLFPLMLSIGGQQSFDQIFDVRIALESRTAYQAALRSTPNDCEILRGLVTQFRDHTLAGRDEAHATDLEFHLTIARMTKNPLFTTLLEAIVGFVAFAQRESWKNDPERGFRAISFHQAIAEAIAEHDAERARVEMEAHLRYSATRKLS